MRYYILANHHHCLMVEVRVWRVLAIVTYYRNRKLADSVMPVDIDWYWR